MNNICHTSKLLQTLLFADDTTCFYLHKNVKICETVNNELKEVCNWFKANKLFLCKEDKPYVSGNTFSNKLILEMTVVFILTVANFLG